MAILTLLTLTSFVCGATYGFSMGGDSPCTYDFELEKSTMRVSCPGSPSVVNLYADTATLQADDVRPGVRRAYSSRSQTRGSSRLDQEKSHGEMNTGDEQFSQYVQNATVRLDTERKTLSRYSNTIQNINLELSKGELNLRADMQMLRSSTETADKLKQSIEAAMKNQFTFWRTIFQARNEELENLVRSLGVLMEVTTEAMYSAMTSHQNTLDKVSGLNTTLYSMRNMLIADLRKKGKRRWKASKQGKRAKGEDD